MTDPTQNRDPGVGPAMSDSPAHGHRIEELLAALALQREADAMIAEALETRRAAAERAETLMRVAEDAASRAEEDAAAAASRRISAACEQAGRLLAEAQDQASQITRDAHEEVTAVRHEAADLRSSAEETIAAAELEWQRARRAEAHYAQRLHATQSVASRMIENLEQVAVTLDETLKRVRGEVASARRELAQLQTDSASSEIGGVEPSVVLPWPHDQGTSELADSAPTDESEPPRTTKHRRFENRNRRGQLR